MWTVRELLPIKCPELWKLARNSGSLSTISHELIQPDLNRIPLLYCYQLSAVFSEKIMPFQKQSYKFMLVKRPVEWIHAHKHRFAHLYIVEEFYRARSSVLLKLFKKTPRELMKHAKHNKDKNGIKHLMRNNFCTAIFNVHG